MKTDFPKSRFSLPFEPRERLVEPRVRAIVDCSNGRRGRTNVPTAALVLLVCVLCVNLVSCSAVQADSDGQAPAGGLLARQEEPFGPLTEPVPTDPDSTEPAFNERGSATEQPRGSILKVLEGREKFTYVEKTQDTSISKVLDLADAVDIVLWENPDKLVIKFLRYTAVDLDGDGTVEAILDFTFEGGSGYTIGYLILHTVCDKVYADIIYSGSFMDLKTDGTFESSDGSAVWAYGRITSFTDEGNAIVDWFTEMDCYEYGQYLINGEAVSQADFNKVQQEQDSKPNAEWHDFDGGRFADYFE